MNTSELNCILERALVGTDCKFLGVFAADRIPNTNTFPSCFVASTDPARLAGTHWVACYCSSRDNIEFFDSYGFPPSFYEYLELPFTPTKFNHVSFQALNSSVCGHYCVYFLCNRAYKRPLRSLQLDLKRVSQSDHFVRTFLSQVVRKLGVARRCFRQCRGLQCCKSRKANCCRK